MLPDMKTNTKIIIGFACTIVVSLLLAFIGRQGLASNTEHIVDIGKARMPSVFGLEEMRTGILHIASGYRGLVNRRMLEPTVRQANYDEVAQGIVQGNEGKRIYESLPSNSEEEVIWRSLIPPWEEYQRLGRAIIDLSREKDTLLASGAKLDDPRITQLDERTYASLDTGKRARFEAEKHLNELIRLNNGYGKVAVQKAVESSNRSTSALMLILVLGLAAAIMATVVLSRNVSGALHGLKNEAQLLTKAAVAGQLSTRARLDVVPREFQGILQGMNETLDAVIQPLNVTADCVDKISRGNIPPKITDTYAGDFNTIKTNLNRCIDAVNSLITDTDALVRASVEGRLSTRADPTRHEGDFRKIVDGVNQTLDAVISPVMAATNALEALARYDMRVRVEGNYHGDHARIKDALNGTAAALQRALVQVAESVEQVAGASQQIAASSQSVSQGASEQASALEETSSSLEEMSGMTKQNADNTIQARSLAQKTKEVAEKGGEAMTRMTDAMERIRAASEGTAEIIKDINDIAFQTNLLALNAAVEAARAGDAGRGFAVVAEEVRNLAQRSKEAAKKTEDLIKLAVGHSENGRVITNEVAGNLQEIVSAAAKVNDIVGEIALASQEQSRGIEQVNTAVAQMDKVVQASASNAEESSSAAEELASQSEELRSLVQRFELDQDSRRPKRLLGEGSENCRRATLPQSLAPVRRGSPHAPYPKKPVSQSRKLTPEEVIPLESEPEFQDF